MSRRAFAGAEALEALRRCPMCAAELADALGITPNAAQLRLWSLRKEGLIVEWDRVTGDGHVGRRRVVYAPAETEADQGAGSTARAADLTPRRRHGFG